MTALVWPVGEWTESIRKKFMDPARGSFYNSR